MGIDRILQPVIIIAYDCYHNDLNVSTNILLDV